MYLASYVSKPEGTLGDVLKSVSKSSQHLRAKISLKSVAPKFLTHREVSAQEAVYRLLSLPLYQGTRLVVFIDTDLPENRTRLFKPVTIMQLSMMMTQMYIFMECSIGVQIDQTTLKTCA